MDQLWRLSPAGSDFFLWHLIFVASHIHVQVLCYSRTCKFSALSSILVSPLITFLYASFAHFRSHLNNECRTESMDLAGEPGKNSELVWEKELRNRAMTSWWESEQKIPGKPHGARKTLKEQYPDQYHVPEPSYHFTNIISFILSNIHLKQVWIFTSFWCGERLGHIKLRAHSHTAARLAEPGNQLRPTKIRQGK